MPKFSPERRNFTLAAAAAATAVVLNPADALAGLSHSGTALQAPAQPSPSAMDKLSADGKAEVEMKFASINRKYASRLNDDQKNDILRQLAEAQDGLEKMRAFALSNADQPATVFQLYRNEGKK
jgi:hypothetical protein